MKLTTLLSLLPVIYLCSADLAKAQPSPPTPVPSPSVSVAEDSPVTRESAYNEYMRLGYAAAKREDYQSAARYFRSALFYRPQDRDATIAYWNAKDALRQNPGESARSDYDRYMEIGYDAVEQEDYQTALINFRRALEERPDDYYATQAVRNVNTYINRGEEEPEASPTVYTGESAYDRYMRLGFAAAKREDYRRAARYFRSALYERPDDRQATIAFWNAQDVVKEGTESATETESDYDRYMRIGYDAAERENYQTALINFRRALRERPDDYYATQAVRNVQTYINRGEARSTP
ncbi:MAG: hypothetical protein ACFB4I_00125 [Cyanophyceae cyanobacterium]